MGGGKETTLVKRNRKFGVETIKNESFGRNCE